MEDKKRKEREEKLKIEQEELRREKQIQDEIQKEINE